MSRRRRPFGAVRKLPSGRWQASYVANGRRILADRTFATKQLGADWLTGVEADLLRGSWVDPRLAKGTLGDYSKSWLGSKTGLAERTVELYAHLLEVHIIPALGATALGEVTPPQVRTWYGDLAARHASTAAKAYRLLSSIFRAAVDDGVIGRSPCTIRGAGAEPEREWVVVTQTEALRIADAMPIHLRAVVILAAWCALRRAELLGLRWADVDLRSGLLTVRQTRTTLMAGGLVEKPPKSRAGSRTVAMPQIAVEALQSHRERLSRPAPRDLVFTGAKNGPLRPQVLWSAIDKATAAVGLSEVRLHDLRHSGLTWVGQAGATVAELMYRGGHASPAAALRYQHATRARDAELAKSLSHVERTPRRGRSKTHR